MDPKQLTQYGLSECEARVYLSMLQIGRAKSGAIIRATSLQSSTVYNALSSLLSKGLASFVLIGKTKHFSAEPPESFLFFLEEKKRRFGEMLPSLKKMEANAQLEHKSAKVFVGMKGLRSAFNDVYMTMGKGEEYYFFQVATEDLRKKRVYLFFKNWHLRRSAKGVRVRGLALEVAREYMKGIYELPHTKVRFVDDFLPTATLVYKDKVILIDLSGGVAAFQIQSQNVADSYRKLFETKWETARK